MVLIVKRNSEVDCLLAAVVVTLDTDRKACVVLEFGSLERMRLVQAGCTYYYGQVQKELATLEGQ